MVIIAKISNPLYLMPLLRGSPWNFETSVELEKIRIMHLPNMYVCPFV